MSAAAARAQPRPTSTGRKSGQNTYASVIEGYENVEIIGKGSFGSIRKVARKSDGKLFARKELCYDRMTDRDRKQIVAEVNILKALNHKNIVKYEERFADADANMLYIVMEYCEAGDLGSVIKKCRRSGQRLPEDTIWSYFSQLVQALDACHNGMPVNNANPDAGTTPAILHRDIKPENVFLNHEGHIKLGDFGLSKQLGAAHTFANTYVGTPYYMSPELATGSSYDVKSDIWALGCVVFELCALSPPFDATSQAELTIKIKSGQVPCLPRGYSRELGDVIREMLALNARRRPTTRQLLEVPQIKFTLKTLDLTDFARQLKSKEASLVAREEAMDEREAAINRQGTHADFSSEAVAAELRAKQAEIEAMEAALVERETYLNRQQELLLEQIELLKAQEMNFDNAVQREVETRITAEKDAWRAAMLRGPRTSDLTSRNSSTHAQEREAALARTAAPSASSPVPAPLAGIRASASGVGIARPVPLARRTSGDASMEGITRRTTKLAMAAATGSGARRRRSAVSERSIPAGRQSTTSDGWIDTPNDNPDNIEDAAETGRRRQSNSARQSPSDVTSSAAGSSIPGSSSIGPDSDGTGAAKAPRKPMPPRTSAVARLLERERYNPAADKSDITMKDVTIDEKENDSVATSGSVLRTQLQKARRITLEQRLAQEAAEEAMEEALRQQKQLDEEGECETQQHEDATVRRSSPRESHIQGDGAVKSTWNDTVPIYDISNDPDLPSPFLRKTDKVSPPPAVLKKIKASAPSFAQRTAAVRAANNATASNRPTERRSSTTTTTTARSTAPLPVRRSTTATSSSSSTHAAPSSSGPYIAPSSRLMMGGITRSRPSLAAAAAPRRSTVVAPLRD